MKDRGRTVPLLPEVLPAATENFHVLYPIEDSQRDVEGSDVVTADAADAALRRAQLAQIVAATEKLSLGIFYKEHRRMSTSSMKE